MSASYTAERGHGTGTTNGSGVFTFSPAATCTQGATLYLPVFVSAASSTVSAVSDDAGGNSWHVDVTNGPSGQSTSVVSVYLATGLTTTNVITVTTGGLTKDYGYWLEEFSLDYSSLDQSATGTASNSTSIPTGTTAATTTADEVAISVYASSSNSLTYTKNTNYTAFTTGSQPGPSVGSGFATYRILTATGTQNADATGSTMSTTHNLIATYKNVAHGHTPRNPAVNFNDPAFMFRRLEQNVERVGRILVPRLWTPRPV